MALCERENQFLAGKLYVYNLKNIPVGFASKTEWKRRGYRVIEKRGKGQVNYWNGRHYQNFALYDINQTVGIRGVKAKKRRKDFWEKIYASDVPF